MKLSKPQKQIADDPHRFKVAICGRRFGKTYLAIREICYHAREPNQEVWYLTTSYRAAKMICWRPLKAKLLDLRWVKKINEAELSILLKNGTTISLKGAEDYDRLRGAALSYIVLDEVSTIPPAAWTEVIRPALADREGKALFIGTPMGKNNWSYDLYNQAESQPAVWRSWQFTTLDGGRVSAEEIEQARADMSERQFRQEFLATWEDAASRVAWSFSRERNVKELADPDLKQLHIGCDFNVSPVTATVGVRDGEDLYIIDEIVMFNSNTTELAQEIQNRYPRSNIICYPDPAGSASSTKANGMTDHIILQNHGFAVKAPHRHDPVRDRINIINARFRGADNHTHLYISKKCKYTIESMEKYTFKEGTQVPDKGTYDHIFDALSYCTAYLYPLKRIGATQKPMRWGTKTL